MLKIDRKPNLLEGNLLKTIIKLGYPVALASFVQTFYNLADTFWLGKLGRVALSAPIISFYIIFFVVSLAIGFSMAGTSLVAQYTGAKQKEKADKTTGNLLLYMFIFSLFCAAFGLIFSGKLLSLLKTPTEAFSATNSYFRIMMMGMPFAFPIFVYQSVMNGFGDTKSPLKIELISALINVVLDPILIFGWFGFPAMGVQGAALTSVISRGVASIIGVYLLFSGKKGIKLKAKHLKPDRELFPLLVKIGIPASIGMSGASLGFMVLMGFVNLFGTPVVSAYGIASRVIHFFTMPSMGITAAVTAIVGQNLGANNLERAKETVKKGIHLMIAILVPAVVAMVFFGKAMTVFFIPGDPLVHRLGQTMFYIISPSVLFFGLTAVLNGAFQGSGYTVPVMVTHLARIWIFRIPLVYLLAIVILKGPANINASVGIWWAMFLSNFLSFVMILIWYSRGKWAKAIIPGEQGPSKGQT
ncbi:MAG: MATE family efflux transporter [Candidatus Aminicenantes bacterium]|nr:MATE family efflux transporter [Candidatus Aminicenantes bacterium]